HLREPGHEYKETIKTGTKAAAAGGFTAVAAMPNTNPIADQRAVIEYVANRAKAEASARVWPIGAMTMGQRGRELCEYADLAEGGAVGVSDDGFWVAGGRVMRRVLEYARVFGLTAISHPEDLSLSSGGFMNEGRTSTALGLTGSPAAAEDIAVSRVIALARLTGVPLHLAHLSTQAAINLVR
ncbi:MAG: amidohydrolase family protein, partial [Deltaproteobacteria bacterium]|nr:amidohydrolase family protein [Deltaproteobacteria bacterium]